MSDDLRSTPVTGSGLIVVALVVGFVVAVGGVNWLVDTVATWGMR